MQQSPRHFVFYHADRAASLQEGQAIELDENKLSYFGKVYWPILKYGKVEDMDDMQQREYYLEHIKRRPEFSLYASRMQSLFAANTIAEAIVFAQEIDPKPNRPIPIIEIYADRFWTLDSTWLDYADNSRRVDNYRNYWNGIITNNRPEVGERRAPRLEVMIALPARAGKIVHILE